MEVRQHWRRRFHAADMSGIAEGRIEPLPFQNVVDGDIRQMYQSKEMLFDSGRKSAGQRDRYFVGFRAKGVAAAESRKTCRGGNRQGAGRHSVRPSQRREVVSVRLPAWVADWLKRQPNAGRLIKRALVEHFGLMEPEG